MRTTSLCIGIAAFAPSLVACGGVGSYKSDEPVVSADEIEFPPGAADIRPQDTNDRGYVRMNVLPCAAASIARGSGSSKWGPTTYASEPHLANGGMSKPNPAFTVPAKRHGRRERVKRPSVEGSCQPHPEAPGVLTLGVVGQSVHGAMVVAYV